MNVFFLVPVVGCKYINNQGHYHFYLFFADFRQIGEVSVPDPDPPDPHVFGLPGSGSTSKRY
jgi:hypothetical protein